VKINGDRTSAGLPLEKNEKSSRTVSKTGTGESAKLAQTSDELELTSKSSVIFNTLRGAQENVSESSGDELASIRTKLSALTGSMLANPTEALAAQGNLNAESVALLVS
jgi:hypothetical protein